MKRIIAIFLLLVIANASKGAERSPVLKTGKQPRNIVAAQDSLLCTPLKPDNIYSVYTYVIDLRDPSVIAKYQPIFSRHNYAFTGYVWKGILNQIIRSADKDIAQNVFVSAVDNVVCFTVTRFKVKAQLPEYMCPILSNPQQLEACIKKVDRNQIANY